MLHSAVHEAHPDIVAMCHAHTTYGTAWCATGRPLDMISQDAACFYDNHVVIGASAGAVAVEKRSGQSVAELFWFIALERCCQVQLLIEASGVKPQAVPEASARYSREHVGNDFIGWLHFQTLFDQIAATQPDMFD